ncbi:hypothetical protein BABINDRAFT_159487 [Babjeviella inositovora NRRL Y-12698]|uniref:CNH domain-containing protein n=1 Tax=Babjeviella inositovora NRRL Y-12698 TaxID=984486 RepID=A0A1E3QZB1_9ASCO|nr:uncharacterized protein BABINDRAFT_159487 [Babjeviella inositovora NRRL Y-12698]ODQ83010.1 hypothetical protein BABINDRAFT_159487 [Babjeviella inositovora NRRL Y-12698]
MIEVLKLVSSLKVPSPIASVCALKDVLFVGSTDGTLLLYQYKKAYELIHRYDNITKGPITDINYVPSIDQVALTTGGSSGGVALFRYDGTLQHAQDLPGATGNGLVSRVFEIRNTTYLIVLLRKSLYVYKWTGAEYGGMSRVSIGDRALAVEPLFDEQKLLVGTSGGISVVDLVDYKVSTSSSLTASLFPVKPHSFSLFGTKDVSLVFRKLSDERMLIVKENSSFVLLKRLGEMKLLNSPIEITESVAIHLLPPVYLINSTETGIGVVNRHTGKLYGMVESKEITSTSVAEWYVVVASKTEVSRYELTSFQVQLDQLRAAELTDDAISVLSNVSATELDNRFGQLRTLQIQRAEGLFQQQKFTQAMDVYAEWLANPRDVLGLVKEDPEMKDLKRSLIYYLTSIRRTMIKLLNHQEIVYEETIITRDIFGTEDLGATTNLVDDALLRSYLLTSSNLVGSLLRVQNYCSEALVEERLTERKLYRELLDFYFCRELHDKALTLLVLLTETEEAYGPEAVQEYLVKLATNPLYKDSATRDLVFKYTKWLLEKDGPLGMAIITHEELNRDLISSESVIAFLDTGISLHFEVEYLEYLIRSSADNSAYNTELCGLYIRQLQNFGGDVIEAEAFQKLLRFLNSTKAYEPRTVLKQLKPLLTANKAYFYLKIGIMRRLNAHAENLNIYINELEQPELAVDYCLSFFEEGNDNLGRDLLYLLLDNYVQSPVRFREDIVVFLSNPKITPYLSMLEILPRLPAEMFQVVELLSFLSSQIKKMRSVLNSQRMTMNLSQVQLVKLEEELLVNQKVGKKVVVDDSTLCEHCGRKLGHSVLAWFPDDAVVHYGCSSAYKLS